MQVSLDGGSTWKEVEEVRVIHSNELYDLKEQPVELHSIHTYEGTIIDAYDKNGELLGTQSATAEEIVEVLV